MTGVYCLFGTVLATIGACLWLVRRDGEQQ